MRTPYGLNIIDNCVTCPVREEHLFCNLADPILHKLNEVKSTAVYPRGAILFIRAATARSVYSFRREGETFHFFQGGQNDHYQTLFARRGVGFERHNFKSAIPGHRRNGRTGQANFVARDAFLVFLREHGDVAVRVAEQLSRNYYAAYDEIKTLGLATSPSEKFARLLLAWPIEPRNITLRMTLTHEGIAEMIGTTRETVSRLFLRVKKKEW